MRQLTYQECIHIQGSNQFLIDVTGTALLTVLGSVVTWAGFAMYRKVGCIESVAITFGLAAATFALTAISVVFICNVYL